MQLVTLIWSFIYSGTGFYPIHQMPGKKRKEWNISSGAVFCKQAG